jgi:hypothetical protein
MVPMRSIFEALGASVQWTESTQTVMATRSATNVQLTIGQQAAQVNGRTIGLDVPAMIYGGSTMVPLRFVSEALGADVRWSEATQTVSMFTTGAASNYQPVQMQPVRVQPVTVRMLFLIPIGTVVPVSLDRSLNSATTRAGDRFTVTVWSSRSGDAEFPRGTRLVGTVAGVQRATVRRPGILDLSFREARLPDGSAVRIYGSVISLDDRTVNRPSRGRLVAMESPTSNNRQKMIGIGAGAGMIIGKVLDQNVIVGGLLGAAAGYAYSRYTADTTRPRDVVVRAGTVFGVRMDRDVRYSAPVTFVTDRNAYYSNH